MRTQFEMVAQGWARIDKSERRKHYNTIRICLFSPFLFGKSYVNENWLEWMQYAGFLKSAKRLEVRCYDDSFFFSLDILDKMFEALHSMMEKPIFFYSCMAVVDEIDSLATNPEDCIRIGKGESTFSDFFNDEGDTFEKRMALLYCVKSYLEYVDYIIKYGKSRIDEIKPPNHFEKRIQSYKGKGNTKFQEGLYSKAIALYSKALQLDPYNHILYGNRAQTYLKTEKFQDALWDSRRALVLKPNWSKGCYRYAQAFFELDYLERALTENSLGCKYVEDSNERRDLESQKKKFNDIKNGVVNKKKQDDDDVPDLVDQCGSSDESVNDSLDLEGIPDLVSDGLDSFSDDASDSEFIEPTQAYLAEIRKKRMLREKKIRKKRIVKEEKIKEPNPSVPASFKIIKDSSGRKGVEVKVTLQRKPQPTDKKQPQLTEKAKPQLTEKAKPQLTEKTDTTPKICSKPNHDLMSMELYKGSVAHLDKNLREALIHYQKVVKFMQDSSIKFGGMDEVNYVAFTYCYAQICLDSNIPDEIQKSEQLFSGILKDHGVVCFPLAYYGLGCYYQRVNRFSEAIEYLKKGLKSLHKSRESQPEIYWPGTSEPVRESVKEYTWDMFQNLLHDCKNPPEPLGTCTIKECSYIKRSIYLTDLDFKGFVHVTCTESCRLDYHINCWKIWKVEFFNRTHEKDILNKECSTPDCLGTIHTISTYGSDGTIKSEAKADQLGKTKHPQKPVQPPQPAMSKSKKKRQRKKQRKIDYEEESSAHNNEVISENTDHHSKSKDIKPKKDTNAKPVAEEQNKKEIKEEKEEIKKEEILEKQVDYEFVLKKDDIEELIPSHTKATKKKKQKSKEKHKTLADFQIKFTGDEDRRFWGHEDADENGYIEYKKYMTPMGDMTGFYPPELAAGISTDKNKETAEHLAENMDETVFMLYSYFHAVLEKEGPLPVTSHLLLDEFKTFPYEVQNIVNSSGGLAPFLLKSLKFAMFEDHICLLKHAVKCKEILARKHGVPIEPELAASLQQHDSPERPPKDFQPLLTPFEFKNLTEKLVKKNYNTLDGVDDIPINENGSDDDKISEPSDIYSTASETDPNGLMDPDDASASTTTTENDEGMKNSEGSQESKTDLPNILDDRGSKKKKTIIDDFQGDEEYIDDDILGKEKELERYMMEGSSVDAPILKVPSFNIHTSGVPLPYAPTQYEHIPNTNVLLHNVPNIAKKIIAMSDGESKSNSQTSENDSGIGTFSPVDPTPCAVDTKSKSANAATSSKPENDTSSNFGTFEEQSKRSVLPIEIIEGFCLNKPTPYSYDATKTKQPEPPSKTIQQSDDNILEAQEKMWDQALDLFGTLTDFEWFTMDRPPSSPTGEIVQIPACLWELVIGCIKKLRDHCLDIEKKKMQMKCKFVQCTPKTKNVCLITTPYEPYKQEYLEMKTKNNQIRESLKDTMTKYSHLEKNSDVEILRLKDEIKKIQSQNEDLTKKLTEKVSLAEKQQKQWQKDLASHVKEAKAKDDKMKKLDDDLVKMTTELSKASQKMNVLQQERDKHFAEQTKIKESIESIEALKNRAEHSEIQLLKVSCQKQCKTLMDVIKEAERNRDKLVNADKGDNQLDAAIQTWEATIKMNTKKVRELKNNYDVLIQTVLSGTPLENLPPIADVLPFWPPPQAVNPKTSVSTSSDVKHVPQVQHAPSNAANQQSWLSAQQNEAKRREASQMMSKAHQPTSYGHNPLRQQRQHVQESLPHGSRQMPPEAYSNGSVRPKMNSHIVTHGVGQGVQQGAGLGVTRGAGQGGPHGAGQGVPQGVGLGVTRGAGQGVPQGAGLGEPQKGIVSGNGSHSVPQQPTGVAAAASVSSQAAAAKSTTTSAASETGKGQAHPQKQGTVGSKVAGRVIPPAPAHLKNSFDKLTYQLGVMFDNQYTKGQLAMFLKEVRAANGGSLSGLPSKEIIDRVVKMILKKEEEHPVNKPAKASYSKKMPPGINISREASLSTWKTMPIKNPKPLNLEEEDPCVICHEEMPFKPVSKLECQHIFHTDCIQRWMNEQKTCPTCREFVLLPDDYPSL